jgi:hypothetical protein
MKCIFRRKSYVVYGCNDYLCDCNSCHDVFFGYQTTEEAAERAEESDGIYGKR